MEQLLSSVAAFGAALDRAGQLRKMQHAKVRLRMVFAKVGEGARNGFRRDQAEIIEVIGSGSVGIVRV